MAQRELKLWHHQVTTALAVVTLLCAIWYFVESFRTFFLTDHDPVLIAIDRIETKLDKR